MKIDSNSKNLITPEKLSEILSISKVSVYRLVEKREIPFFKVGGSIRFLLADIEKYLANSRIESIKK